ncbi:tetratricopeptide repeat protein [Planctomycetota bacterium]
MVVKHKTSLTTESTWLAIGTVFLLLIDIYFGYSVYNQFTLKSKIEKGIKLASLGRHDDAVSALEKAIKAIPDYPYTYDLLAKIKSENETTGKSMPATAIYEENMSVNSRYANSNIGYTLAALQEYYKSNVKYEAKDLAGKIINLKKHYLDTALMYEIDNMDARVLDVVLNAELVLLRACRCRWRNDQYRLSKDNETKALRGDVAKVIKELEGILTEANDGSVEQDFLPTVEVLVLGYNALGCLTVLQGDMGKESKRIPNYEVALANFRRASAYRLVQANMVGNLMLTYGRILGDSRIDTEKFEKYRKDFNNTRQQVKYFTRGGKLFDRYKPAIFKAAIAAANGLYRQGTKRQDMKLMTKAREMFFEAKSNYTGEKKDAVLFEMQNLRVLYDMFGISEATGQPMPLNPEFKRLYNRQDLVIYLKKLSSKTKSHPRKEVYAKQQLMLYQAYLWVGSIRNVKKLAKLKVDESLPETLQADLLRTKAIYYDCLSRKETREAKQQQCLKLAVKSYNAYRRFVIANKEEIHGRRKDLENVSDRIDQLSGRIN